jgi:manganese-dependent inorganic pyrophosphatase
MSPSTDRSELWDPTVTYVIGHQRPDTDAIASALGYAWFLQESGRTDVSPARAGQPGDQARYALERFEQSAPRLLTGVAPTFHHVLERREAVPPETPLFVALDRLGQGEKVVPVRGADGKPAGVVTPLALARAFALFHMGKGGGTSGSNYIVPNCGGIAEPVPTFLLRERVSDHRGAILRAESTEFVLVDDAGNYAGMTAQRRLLHPPRARLILVDHNELPQAVPGADEAEIVGVLDHHRLGNPPTAAPIPFTVDPVGSTSTLVAELCRARRLTPPRPVAGMLLSGILSDTLVFRSPTTHERDREAAQWLGILCQIDVALYGEELLYAAPGLGRRTADEIIDTDRKAYEMGGVPVSIAQVEVTGMQEVPDWRDRLLEALELRREKENLALIALMVTDVVTGRSRLLARGEADLLEALPYARVGDGEFDLEDVVSRKKQLAPAIQTAIESVVGY